MHYLLIIFYYRSELPIGGRLFKTNAEKILLETVIWTQYLKCKTGDEAIIRVGSYRDPIMVR